MHYFITSEVDEYTSAIEKAEIQRLKIFDKLKESSMIVTCDYRRNSDVLNKLKIEDRVINLYRYFQGTPQKQSIDPQNFLLSINNGEKHDNETYVDGNLRINVHMIADEGYVDYVEYTDRFGFVDRRDFYDYNNLSYSEFYDDGGKLITKSYYDQTKKDVLTCHYRGGPSNQPILTLIQVDHENHLWQFDDKNQLIAYFLDCLANENPNSVFYSDREDVVVEPFKLMKTNVKRYVIVHAAFTENSRNDGNLYPYIESTFDLGDKLNGIISSTKKEAEGLKSRAKSINSYHVPVSFVPDNLIQVKSDFNKRIPGRLIAIARLTKVKQLDHLINTVIKLHAKLPFVTLNIYGYEDSWNNYEESRKLHKLVKENDAENYITFCGYYPDLSEVYETADLMVLTSENEGFSMAILEALGHGCPVVSYDINYGPSEMIVNGINGQLVTPNDQLALYKNILYLLRNRDVLKEYSRNAPISMHKFSFTRVTQQWGKILSTQSLPTPMTNE